MERKSGSVISSFQRLLLLLFILVLAAGILFRACLGPAGEQGNTVTPTAKDSHPVLDGMVLIPAGMFWFGCANTKDRNCDKDEMTGRWMYASTFWIDRYEVTTEQYRACVQAGACTYSGLKIPVWFNEERHPELAWSCNWGKRDRDKHPINCVSWSQATQYCAWLNKRLPTDIEFEKAARGDKDDRIYPWGDDSYGTGAVYANIADKSALSEFPDWPAHRSYDDGAIATAPVGSYPDGISPYGVYDLIGNVEEWTSDWYDEAKSYRSIRGASWHRAPTVARISREYPSAMSSQPDYGGFRCAFSQ
jgi:formylglycine-generating enzyme required for sulfatase activity